MPVRWPRRDTVALLVNAGDTTFFETREYELEGDQLAAADLDGDGITDLITADTELHTLSGGADAFAGGDDPGNS